MTNLEFKEIRKKLKMKQAEIAEAIGVGTRAVQYWEKGERKIPETTAYFVKNMLQEQQQKPNNSASPVAYSDLKIMYVPLANQYAQAGYLSRFADEEYIESLPTIPFSDDVEHRGEYMCFEVRGDSMDDGSYESYLEGDIILCRNIRQDYWMSKLHYDKWDFVIVHKEKGILVKRIINHDVERGIITLHSLNEYYEDFEIHLQDVAKLFNIISTRRKNNRR
ncbi:MULTISPECIES: S24 family peptidase [Chryseobacterium]|jgi:phage repressor protein C with HTH and peptisase S24 domain|uniref:Helix-turn-helix domain-containing protein n=1 Tax=Chryseobacterium indicum TaxID=2766954 RepID=A0ABS9C2B1_9FLAO|nr:MULTISPECIES: S24 family peptidase [unclassified Chryseobacterium]MCF2218362.1 helix-turn-helix domain-containing protein [Chryseobacterium sp. PS-8]